jgi:hypothetical protein
VAQDLTGPRVGDERPLVADDRVVEPRLGQVATHGLKHPPGDDHDVEPRLPRGADRRDRTPMQDRVLGDQGPVEVRRDQGDVAREVVRERQPEVAWWT